MFCASTIVTKFFVRLYLFSSYKVEEIMSLFEDRGNEIRALSKALLLDFMKSNALCQPNR